MVLTKEDLQAIEGLFKGRFESIDERFESIDKRFESIDERFENMDKRFESMDKRFESMDKRFDGIDMRLDGMGKRIDGIDSRLEKVESEVSALKAGQRTMQQQINIRLDKISRKLSDTYNLALDNWGQIEESKTRLGLLEATEG